VPLAELPPRALPRALSLSLIAAWLAACDPPPTPSDRLDQTVSPPPDADVAGAETAGAEVAGAEVAGAEVAPDMLAPDMLAPDMLAPDRCAALGRCSDAGGWCEPADAPACWASGAPVCYPADHPISRRYCADAPPVGPHGCDCPEGYEVSLDGDACVRAEGAEATFHGARLGVCAAADNVSYGKFGALYPNTDGDASNDFVQSPYWGQEGAAPTGRLNAVGVWACDAATSAAGTAPVGEWIGFSRCLTVEEAGDYLVGIAGDNRVRLKVDGQLVFERDSSSTSNFNYWHIQRLALSSGVHFIELSGLNDGLVAAFGAEISGPFPAGALLTEEAMKAADYAGNIVFSTGELAGGGLFDLGANSGWSCPEGFALNTCGDAPSCSR